jgi:ABC-type glycerol-3-phosphate transport system substrate-binding protein
MMLCLAGCIGSPGDAATQSPSPTATRPAPTIEIRPTATLASVVGDTAEPPQVLRLVVWTPEQFTPGGDAPGGQDLADLLVAFDETRPDIQVEFFPKIERGTGGITGYLRSAPGIAPGLLPDLTLLDRDTLADLAREQRIVPVGALVDPAVVEGLYPVAREVGTVEGQLVGLPYLVELDHAVYDAAEFNAAPVTFEAVLASRRLFTLSAGATGDASSVLLLQYMDAGGSFVDDNGQLALDPEALTIVLSYYARASEQGLFDAANLQAPDAMESWEAFRAKRTPLAAITSTAYLSTGVPPSTQLMTVPSATGRPFTLVRGWSWVVVTTDPDHQTAAMALVNFLMNPVSQGRYSEAAGWLPSQPGALAVWGQGHESYGVFVKQMLDSGVVMPDPSVRIVVGMAIQNALEAVVLDGVSPADAAQDAADAVRSGA